MWISPRSLTWQPVCDLGTREQARNSRSSSSPAVAWARYFLYRWMSWSGPGSGNGSFHRKAKTFNLSSFVTSTSKKNLKRTLISTLLWLHNDLLFLKKTTVFCSVVDSSMRIRIEHFCQCGSGCGSRILMTQELTKFTAENILYFFWSKIAFILSLGLHKGGPCQRSHSSIKREQ